MTLDWNEKNKFKINKTRQPKKYINCEKTLMNYCFDESND